MIRAMLVTIFMAIVLTSAYAQAPSNRSSGTPAIGAPAPTNPAAAAAAAAVARSNSVVPTAGIPESGAPTGQIGIDRPLVSALVLRDIPAPTVLAVEPRDDTDVNLQIARQFEAELKARGIRVDRNAPLAIRFTSGSETALSRGRGGSLGEARVENDVESRVILNLWSNSKDSVVGGRVDPAGGIVDSRFRLRATLDDRRNGERLWQGDAVVAQQGRDEPLALSQPMVSALVPLIGKTQQDAPLPVAGSDPSGQRQPMFQPLELDPNAHRPIPPQ